MNVRRILRIAVALINLTSVIGITWIAHAAGMHVDGWHHIGLLSIFVIGALVNYADGLAKGYTDAMEKYKGKG